MILEAAQLVFVPITGSVWWFVTAYIVLMLVVPSYNRFLERLSRQGMLLLLLLLLLFGYTFGNLGSNFHDLEKALFFYTLGVYFKDYVHNINNKRIIFFWVFSFTGVIINGICQYKIFTYALLDTSNAVIFRKAFSMAGYLIAEPLACIGIFGLFSIITIHSKKVNWIAKHTFGVYLFHEAPAIRVVLWLYILQPWKSYGKTLFFIYVPACVLVVFITGVLADVIREKVFGRLMYEITEKAIEKLKIIGLK